LATRSSFSPYFFYFVSKVNTYAAANVRVEEGQRVIDTGVYSLVRHPMYFGALLLIAGTPIALGSWWTLLLTPIFFCYSISGSPARKKCSCAILRAMRNINAK
jgi:protein-S-isoprenylcysteine O-methyltransferase Ste14